MGQINYTFANTSGLDPMVPPALPGGAFGAAQLPNGLAGAGMYIIYNHFATNRYVGISTDLAQRFGARMSVITEMGFTANSMANVLVWWGTVAYCNTGAVGLTQHNNYGAPLTAVIDGVQFNLEHVLIRYVLNGLGAGGTMSNNMFVNNAVNNSTGNAITINFVSAQNAIFPAHNVAYNWAANANL